MAVDHPRGDLEPAVAVRIGEVRHSVLAHAGRIRGDVAGPRPTRRLRAARAGIRRADLSYSRAGRAAATAGREEGEPARGRRQRDDRAPRPPESPARRT